MPITSIAKLFIYLIYGNEHSNQYAALKGFQLSREIIAYATWAYYRFPLSTADVEDLLVERGVIVSRETIRLWVNRFANCIRRNRPRPNDKWHMDEVVIIICGKKHWLWSAIDANGDVQPNAFKMITLI